MRLMVCCALALLACDGAGSDEAGAESGVADVGTPADGSTSDAASEDGARPPADGAILDGSAPADGATPGDGARPPRDGALPAEDGGGPGPDAGQPGQRTPLITELMARNVDTLLDEDGDARDWIEIYNPSVEDYDLTGHHLTDDLETPDKWAFPERVLPARSYLVVFASGKDRRGDELHTDFKLSGDGESVALTDPEGRVLHAIEDWPGQVEGVAYGLPMRMGHEALLDAGSAARLWVGADPEGAEGADFDDSGWLEVPQGIGVGHEALPTDLAPHIGAASAFWLRVPYTLPEGGELDLELLYDDGVAAWMDGVEVYRDNDVLAEARDRIESRALSPVRVPVQARAGSGVIVMRVVDSAATDGQFFAQARLVSPGLEIEPVARYLVVPTPGADNIGAAGDLAPIVRDVDRHLPVVPGEALQIGAAVLETGSPIESVTLIYRVMFGEELRVPMVADEETWQATIPPDVAGPGQMIRWAVEARDALGRVGRFPPYLDPRDSAQYVGTMVPGPEIETNLPVYHWFMENPAAANTEAGGRASLWYAGELYDNIEVDLHGQATTQFPKKSFNFDFNSDHRFRVAEGLQRVKDFDLLTNYADKSKMRNTLSYGMFRDAGHDYHLTFPVRLHLNGEFYALYEFVEDPDERWLRRMGYEEPFGHLYKCYDRLEDPARSEKKTREEEGNADLAAFIAGITQGDVETRRRFFYDHVDMARMANFLAMLFITSGNDCCTKNYYAYHDPETDQWWFMPWDIDLSLGRNFTGTYFNDTMFPRNGLYRGNNNRLVTALYETPEFNEMYLRRCRTLTDELMQRPGTPYEARYLEREIDLMFEHIGADAVLDNGNWGTWGIPQSMAEAVRIMKEEWLIPRREYLYGSLVQGTPGRSIIDGRVGVTRGRWMVPVDDALGVAWTQPDFDDGGWAEGAMGLGYENDDGPYRALIQTEVRPQNVQPQANTVMLRVRFDVDEPLRESLVLKMKYDDGYVAWLNGVEVARRNVAPGPLNWRSEAGIHDDGAAIIFESVDISQHADALRMGENVLAIHAVNTGNNSSDFLLLPALVDGQLGGDGPMPPQQVEAPRVRIDEVVVAGAESYIVVVNEEDTSVDLSDWVLEGRGVTHTLAAGTVIPNGGRLHLVQDLPAFRDREEGPRGGQGLLLQGNWLGALEAEGELALAPGVEL